MKFKLIQGRKYFTRIDSTASIQSGSNNVIVVGKTDTISDLTAMYGAGNEPTTVEQFLTDNPQFNGYVPYTTGSIASAEITDYTLQTDDASQTVSITAEASGLPAVQDEVYCVVENGYLVTKKTARFAKVDLGTLNYEYGPSGATRFISRGIDSLVKKVKDNNEKANIICSKFVAGSVSAVYSGTAEIGIATGLPALWILATVVDTTDPAVFKQAMSGIYLYYELATPVTTELSRVPLTIDFEQVKNVLVSNTNAGIADVHTEVQTGVLKSSVVSGVQVNGANLLDEETVMPSKGFVKQDNGYWTKLSTPQGHFFDNSKLYEGRVLIKATTYRSGGTNASIRIWFTDGTRKNLAFETSSTTIYHLTPVGKVVNYVDIDTSASPTIYIKDFIVCFCDNENAPYRPYKPPFNFSLPSPQELRSAGTAHDVIRLVEQGDGTWNVDKVGNIIELDLGSITYGMTSTNAFYNSLITSQYHGILTNGGAYESLDAFGYTNHGYVNVDTMADKTYSARAAGTLYIKDSRCANANDFRAYMAGKKLYLPTTEPTVTTLMTGLAEQEVATLIELYGSVEIVGNTQKQYAKPNLKTIIQCEKAVE